MQGENRLPDKLRIDLRVVFYREADRWVAHCLEMDLMGDGDDKIAAMQNLWEAIAIQINASIDAKNHANIFMPADARFFEMFAAGKDIAEGQCEVRIQDIQNEVNPQDEITLEDISC